MMPDLLIKKKLFVVCGSGGVGKTTLAASLALKTAFLGHRTIVLTIDPARRLATSLGVSLEGSKARKIDPDILDKINGGKIVKGELFAMMLDTKNTFDEVIARYSPSKDIQHKILENKIYQHLSQMMAGSQEYMAMEKLHEIVSEEKYDIVIIDTPPTVHAIDFLEAPQKMMDAISHSMLHLLLKPAMMVGKTGFGFFEKGSQFILKIFDRITGFAFLQDISEMLVSFKELLGGFQSRAQEVEAILKKDTTSFVVVSGVDQRSVSETKFFIEKLMDLHLPFDGVIANRVSPFEAFKMTMEQEVALSQLVSKELAYKMSLVMQMFTNEADRQKVFLEDLFSFLSKKQFLIKIPLMEEDIHSLEGLGKLSQVL